jgi:hypothetical protein
MALMWYYMTVLFVMLCLAYPAWIQAYDNPITPLPPQWEGSCYIATLAMNVALQARGLTPDTEHECGFILGDRLELSMTVPASSAYRVPALTIRALFASIDAPVSLRFPHGVTFDVPPTSSQRYDPQNPMRLSLGWKGKAAQEIVRHMLQSPSVSLTYQPSTMAIINRILPAGLQHVTLSLQHVSQAWKALHAAVSQLPGLQ